MINKCGLPLISKATLSEVGKSTKSAIFCHNCYNSIAIKKKVPRLSVSNGLQLDEIPYELQIPTDLEQQLFAISLIFMKVTLLPKTRMKGQFDGKMINVPLRPLDVSNTIMSLPRCVDDAAIVPLELKRKQEYKNAHADGYIRPNVCIKAVEKLKKLKNPYYQDVEVNHALLYPPAKKPRLDNESQIEEEVESDSDDSMAEVPILNTVREFQADQIENTCLIREDLDARILENRTDKVIHKRKGKNSAISVQPGEGKVKLIMHTMN